MDRKTIVVFSGGLDSTTLLYHLIALGHEVKAISFDYGQRHRKELDAASSIVKKLQIEHQIVDVTGLAAIFGTNALTSPKVDVPHGEYSPQTMEVTEVPNRNMIMLSIATGWAISLGYDSVAFGAHSGVYTPYTDCQPQFAAVMNAATHVCDERSIEVLAPFIHWTKADIVSRGAELNVPFDLTWSCYEGGEEPCGKCSTCVDRERAFSPTSA
ncbi:MAG: 7-cyano-7-deazaguanine synthase QueC [Gimesia sp.]|nr:7-cyano-7-deazaguanine synthase QueC [Gimesia sp.]